MLDTIRQDLRHGVRVLLTHPGFAAVAVLSIAIGVGANAAIFSVADGLVLRPLGVPDATSIVAVSGSTPQVAGAFGANRNLSYREYLDLRDQARSFSGLLAYRVLITGLAPSRDHATQNTLGMAVSGNFFDVLGVPPVIGRGFSLEEERDPARSRVIVLSHDTWAAQFGSDPGVVGRQVRLGGLDVTVVGVAPQSFDGMYLVLHPAFYVPMPLTTAVPGTPPEVLERRDIRSVIVKGRLAPRVTFEQARTEVSILAAAFERAHPDTNTNVRLLLQTDLEARMEERGPATPGSFLMLGLALVVLLVACANVAGLLTSRAPARAREIAVRMAIGGSRGRVMRQLLTESVVIAAAGGLTGLAIAWAVIRALQRTTIVSDIGVRLVTSLDRRALLVGLVLSAASAVLSSLVPAWKATGSSDLASPLKPGRPSIGPAGRLWGRHGLVVAQVALSFVMLTAAVYIYRTFAREFDRPGFRTTGTLLVSVNPGVAGYDTAKSDALYEALISRARALPGVRTAALTSVVPMNQDGRESSTVVPEGFTLPAGTTSATVFSARIDEGYLGTMAIDLVEGRGITATDRAGQPLVVLVSRAFAERFYPGGSVLGKRLQLRGATAGEARIVGITADSKYAWAGEGPTPFIYIPHRQSVPPRTTLIIAPGSSPAAFAGPMRELVRQVDPNVPVSTVRTMEDFYQGSAVSALMQFLQLTLGMGLIGLGLAVVGLYGLMAYAVARRTREIGIRVAVGADMGTVLRMVLGQGGRIVAAGVFIGLLCSLGAAGILRAIFPSRAFMDLTTYALVVPGLLAVTLLAAYIPARRAARIDPVVALRQE